MMAESAAYQCKKFEIVEGGRRRDPSLYWELARLPDSECEGLGCGRIISREVLVSPKTGKTRNGKIHLRDVPPAVRCCHCIAKLFWVF